MSEKIPIISSQKLIKVLENLGFTKSRSKESHFRYSHKDGRKITVPVHKGKNIGRGLLRKIMRDLNLKIEELKKLL